MNAGHQASFNDWSESSGYHGNTVRPSSPTRRGKYETISMAFDSLIKIEYDILHCALQLRAHIYSDGPPRLDMYNFWNKGRHSAETSSISPITELEGGHPSTTHPLCFYKKNKRRSSTASDKDGTPTLLIDTSDHSSSAFKTYPSPPTHIQPPAYNEWPHTPDLDIHLTTWPRIQIFKEFTTIQVCPTYFWSLISNAMFYLHNLVFYLHKYQPMRKKIPWGRRSIPVLEFLSSSSSPTLN